MIALEKCNKLLNDGFSLITVGESKMPNYTWKKCQSKALTLSQFEKRYGYKGGFFYKNKEGENVELPPTNAIGIVTGYDYLECIDVDLKVFSTAKEKKDFWETLMAYCEDSILDFHEKFTITKTQNEGYHILFKTKRVGGNRKLAVLKGHKEAVIETRGTGGYVFVYDKFLNNKYYSDIQFISDEDHSIIFDIADSFDFKEDKPVIEPTKKERKEYVSKDGDVTPWDDFNSNNDVWDIVSNDFSIVRNMADKMIIKRHGATSHHSGYIFKNNGCMYLHSTGSLYPHEKQVSAYAAYTYKNHNGDFSSSAKALYSEGYGSRRQVQIPDIEKKEIQDQKQRIKQNISFPIEIFPSGIQKYILDCAETLDSSVDYMGCSLLWSLSVIVGNSAVIKVKNDWFERPVLWFALVGKAGIGKTHSINRIIRPLNIENGRAIKKYFAELEKYEQYQSLDKKEKEKVDVVKEPKKSQFIVGDTTIEALVQLHQQSENSIGVFRDELAGWIMDMNKYREGSDQQMWLGTWSGESIIANRVKASSNAYVSQPFLPILGGIQPSILNNFFTEDNKASGFTDRILLSYPDEEVQMYNDKEIDPALIEWYNNMMIGFFRSVKGGIKKDKDDNIKPDVFTWSKEGKTEWIRVFNKITEAEKSDTTNEYLKSILPKIKSYVTRFALLLHVFRIVMLEENKSSEISADTVRLAEKLGDYFIFMAEKIKVNAKEVFSMKNIVKNPKFTNQEKIDEILKHDPDFNRSQLAELLGVSRQTIHKYINQIKN